MPNTKKTLNRLDPITFPIAISGFFFKAATTEVANSGREVPIATRVNPITDSPTPNDRATSLDPSTKSRPPKIKATSPPTIYNKQRHVDNGLISACSSSVLSCAIANVYPRNMAKKQSISKPSALFRIFSVPVSKNTSLAQIKTTTHERMASGISFVNVPLVIVIGATTAVTPTIIKILKMLLPTTFPIESSALPLIADTILTVNSGAEVPKATIVRPITNDDMLNLLANAAAPSVKKLAPDRIKPKSKNKILIMNLYANIYYM